MGQVANLWKSYEKEAEHYDDDGNYYAPMEVWLPILLAEIEAKRRNKRKKPRLRVLPNVRKEMCVFTLPFRLERIPGRSRIKPPAHPLAQLAQGMKLIEEALKSGANQDDCNRYLDNLRATVDQHFECNDKQ